MKYTLLIVVFFLVGCIGFDYDHRISFMSSKDLRFKELPVDVQNCLLKYASDPDPDIPDLLVVNKADSTRFRYEVKETGPWIDYLKIIDSKKNIVYRIERGTPHPYIIYKDKLYLADEYNFVTLYLKEATYSEYELK